MNIYMAIVFWLALCAAIVWAMNRNASPSCSGNCNQGRRPCDCGGGK